MIKRMILMLAVTGIFIGALGVLKFRQIQDAMGQAAAGTTYQQYVSDRWSKEFGAGAPGTLLKQGWIERAGGSAVNALP